MQAPDVQHQPRKLRGARDESTKALQKRSQSRTPSQEVDSPSASSRKGVRASSSGFSREQIRDVLGGPDRGWGSTRYVLIFPRSDLPVLFRIR